jgi:hypothetical protein
MATVGGIALGGGEPFSSRRAADYAAMKATGAAYMRFDVNWEVVEATQGTFNYGIYDAVVNDVAAQGLTSFLVLHTVPSWANAGGGEYAPATNTAHLTNFVYRAVKHFGAMGVWDYEIGNEVNLPHPGWTGTSGTDYATKWLIPAATGALQAQTEMGYPIQIHFGSLAPDSWGGFNPNTFLTQAYAAGAKNYFHQMNFHPYIDTGADTPATSPNMNDVPEDLYATMVANTDGAKKIWATEFGAPTSGNFAITEAAQAALVGTATTKWASHPFAGPLFWYAARDQAAYGQTDREKYFGLLKFDGTPKPAMAAFSPAPATWTSMGFVR